MTPSRQASGSAPTIDASMLLDAQHAAATSGAVDTSAALRELGVDAAAAERIAADIIDRYLSRGIPRTAAIGHAFLLGVELGVRCSRSAP